MIGGEYDADAGEYRFNITRYLQRVITGEFPNNPLSLVPGSGGVQVDRAVLAGPDPGQAHEARTYLYGILRSPCAGSWHTWEKQAYPSLINGLRRLEYRGYDSAGVACSRGDLNVYKCQGKVSDLEAHTMGSGAWGTVGIGHTRGPRTGRRTM